MIALSLLGLSQPPAGADKGFWRDQGDGRGALAIRRVEIGHVRSWEGASTVTVVFDRPVDPADLGRRDFFVLDLSGGPRPRSDVWFYFFGGGKAWFTYSYEPRSKAVTYGGFFIRRLTPNSFKITLPYVDSFFDRDNGGYRFRVASYSRTGRGCASGCFDIVPNASWLIHDWTKPEVRYWRVPEFSSPPGDKPGVPVSFRVTDQGFSGLAGWRLSSRSAGSEEWQIVDQQRSTWAVQRFVPFDQGSAVQLRLEARDGAGNNIRPKTARTVVPYDDSNETAGATFLGLWSQEHDDYAYLNGIHVSSSPLDSFSFTAEAERYCISYRLGEDHGIADFEVGGISERIDMSFGPVGAPGHTWCIELSSPASRTGTVQVVEGTINIDGFWFE